MPEDIELCTGARSLLEGRKGSETSSESLGRLRQSLREHGSTVITPRPSAISLRACNVSLASVEKARLCGLWKSPKESKQILEGISHQFQPGTLTALLGASGAGKTSFLNVLTLNAGGCASGEVLLGGRSLTHTLLRQRCAIVPQEDVLQTSLTPREALRYAALLRMPQSSTPEQRTTRVNAVLAALGLQNCADTCVGSETRKGLSGGERRRLSIGLELITDPAVLFLDEPTSGLDSKAAEDVVEVLCGLSSEGHTVVCTIHQPSWRLFERFDACLLLWRGKVAYAGTVNDLPIYFQGLPNASVPPTNENPLDFVMREIQRDGDTRDLANLWCSSPGAFAPDPESSCESPSSQSSSPTASGSGISSDGTTFWWQFQVLFARHCHDYLKDPDKFVEQIVMKLSIGCLVGVCWYNVAQPAQLSKAGTVSSALFLLVTNSIFDNLFSTVLVFPTTHAVLRREYRNGCFTLSAWFVSYVLALSMFQIVLCSMLSAPVYWLVALRTDMGSVAIFVSCLLLCSCIGVVLGISIGAVSPEAMDANRNVMPVVGPFFMFCGYLIPFPDIPSTFRWIYHCSIFQMGFTTLRLNQYDGVVLSDCDASESVTDCTGRSWLASPMVNANPGDGAIARLFGQMLIVLAVSMIPAWLLVRWKATERTG